MPANAYLNPHECPACNGRGFHWIVKPVAPSNRYLSKASLYKEGERCEVCHGSGNIVRTTTAMFWLSMAVIALTVIAAVAIF